ncbi:S9 family peptidase [Nocardioides bigeumensis]|uniref:Prolyl oligopeptidase family serine peptidase n=1 Tax=Nocardioides bigeumensis TaxID=433657 RepID=A0ABP5KCA7_9ACTN
MREIGAPHPRFPSGRLLTVRPAPGPERRCLLVFEGDEGARGQVWHPRTGEIGDDLPIPVTGDTLLSPDGEWVVDLDDDGGSEVGGLVARRVDGSESRELTPGWGPYVLRGLELSRDGAQLLATAVDDAGHHLVLISMSGAAEPQVLFTSEEEAWLGHLSADSAYASVDTTEHNPGVRRAAVTVVDIRTRQVVATADDLPAGPVRAVRFSPVPGDERILLWTERSGFARPAIWGPLTGERRDYDLADLAGDTLVLDWAPDQGVILVAHCEAGRQRLLAVDEATGEWSVVHDAGGSYADPDVASVLPYYWQSFLGPDGEPVVLTSDWTTPLHALRLTADGTESVVPPVAVPPGRALASTVVTSADGTGVQLWWSAPPGPVRGTILDVHGGPNLVTVDAYRPELQAWQDHGFAVASLNYRGSVTFGRAFREGFWGGAGDREIEDVAAAIAWLRTKGLADPASTFITGPSYGGHLSLLSLGRLPDLFTGAFAVVAMADWAAAWPQMNPAIKKSWTSFLSMGTDGSFDHSRVEAALARFSSINHVESVTGSAWLYQGSRDTRTPPEQARTYAERLRAAGGDVLVEWFDAGHEPTGIRGIQLEFERALELAEVRLAGGRWEGR